MICVGAIDFKGLTPRWIKVFLPYAITRLTSILYNSNKLVERQWLYALSAR
jgi:hypothetical protein